MRTTSIFLFSLLILLVTSHSSESKDPAHYCDDEASWLQWQRLLADNPDDDGIVSLYAFRIGLCSMVKSGQIETSRATKLFESLRNSVLQGKREKNEQAMKDEYNRL